MTEGSKGILEGLQGRIQPFSDPIIHEEEKQEIINEPSPGRGKPKRYSSITGQYFTVKGTHAFTEATVTHLNELKYLLAPLSFNEIFDEAIDCYYQKIKEIKQ